MRRRYVAQETIRVCGRSMRELMPRPQNLWVAID